MVNCLSGLEQAVNLSGGERPHEICHSPSGWAHLGRTAGWKRAADDFYEKNDAPKQIWVRELVQQACVK